MPELPEVETTRRGIAPHLLGAKITDVIIREPRLRWPVTENLNTLLSGRSLRTLRRRAKYLLLAFGNGTLLIHLGMSGSLRILTTGQPAARHDHLDILWSNGKLLRYTDPRRFGAVLWLGEQPLQHRLLRNLGPEPLDAEFDGRWLHEHSRGRRLPVKQLLMDQRIVTGIGNIYANESLYYAGIHPRRAAGRISLRRYHVLATQVRQVLDQAIAQGGSTLKDFVGGDGKPGYFQQQLRVYGRGGLPCQGCGTTLRTLRIAGRNTVYCPRCQR